MTHSRIICTIRAGLYNVSQTATGMLPVCAIRVLYVALCWRNGCSALAVVQAFQVMGFTGPLGLGHCDLGAVGLQQLAARTSSDRIGRHRSAGCASCACQADDQIE